MVDTEDLKSFDFGRAGSSPAPGTPHQLVQPMLNDRYSNIFVTGFGPFGNVVENPSSKLASTSGARFQILEVSFEAVDRFLNELDPNSFEILFLMGVAADRDNLSTEMFGRNFSGRHPDVTGNVRFGPIDSSGILLLPTTLWTAHEVADWIVELPVRTSYDAGEYLCNYIYYRALEKFPSKRVGFLHVPSEQKLALSAQAMALTRILDDITS